MSRMLKKGFISGRLIFIACRQDVLYEHEARHTKNPSEVTCLRGKATDEYKRALARKEK